MGDRVLVEQAIGTVDTPYGTRQWLDDGPVVAGMVAGGFWQVVDRAGADKRKTRAPRVEEVAEDGADPVEPGVPG